MGSQHIWMGEVAYIYIYGGVSPYGGGSPYGWGIQSTVSLQCWIVQSSRKLRMPDSPALGRELEIFFHPPSPQVQDPSPSP